MSRLSLPRAVISLRSNRTNCPSSPKIGRRFVAVAAFAATPGRGGFAFARRPRRWCRDQCRDRRWSRCHHCRKRHRRKRRRNLRKRRDLARSAFEAGIARKRKRLQFAAKRNYPSTDPTRRSVARVAALAANRTVVAVVVAVVVHNRRRLVAADTKAVDRTSIAHVVAAAVVGKNQSLSWPRQRRRSQRYRPNVAVVVEDTMTDIVATDVAVAAGVKFLRCSNVAVEVVAVVEKHYYTRWACSYLLAAAAAAVEKILSRTDSCN